jgi:hypothetical protein
MGPLKTMAADADKDVAHFAKVALEGSVSWTIEKAEYISHYMKKL